MSIFGQKGDKVYIINKIIKKFHGGGGGLNKLDGTKMRVCGGKLSFSGGHGAGQASTGPAARGAHSLYDF